MHQFHQFVIIESSSSGSRIKRYIGVLYCTKITEVLMTCCFKYVVLVSLTVNLSLFRIPFDSLAVFLILFYFKGKSVWTMESL